MPEVALSSVKVENIGLLESEAIFTVRIDNDSEQSLSVGKGIHRFYLNNLFIGKGYSNNPIDVEPFSSIEHPVSVKLSNIAVLDNFQELMTKPELNYRIDSELQSKSLFRESYKTSHEGRIGLGSSR